MGAKLGGAVMRAKLAIIVKGYPRLSETFIARELLALEEAGIELTLYSLRRPYDSVRHSIHDRIAAAVVYLPEYLHEEPARVVRGLIGVIGWRGFWRALGIFLGDFRRDRSRNRLRRFGQAVVLAHELGSGERLIYCHFLHTPASVGRYAALMRGIDWAFSAHAKDIWTIPAWERSEKLIDAAWGVTCTQAGYEHLRLAAPSARLRLIYHGVDRTDLPAPPDRAERDGAGGILTILSVGRIVGKKGYPTLMAALAQIIDVPWRFVHIGGGASTELEHQAELAGIDSRCHWRGALTRDAVMAAMHEADIFVLACRVEADGDRDGLPNVFLEAWSQRLSVIGTTAGAVTEAVIDGETGLIVPPDDPVALAQALRRLIGDGALRYRLGDAGYRLLRERFDFAACVAPLIAQIRAAL